VFDDLGDRHPDGVLVRPEVSTGAGAVDLGTLLRLARDGPGD
jgi:hypothetical protein